MGREFEDELLRPGKVAAICGVTRNTVYRWLRRGVLRRIKIGGVTYVSASALREYLNGEARRVEEAGSVDETVELEARRMLADFRA